MLAQNNIRVKASLSKEEPPFKALARLSTGLHIAIYSHYSVPAGCVEIQSCNHVVLQGGLYAWSSFNSDRNQSRGSTTFAEENGAGKVGWLNLRYSDETRLQPYFKGTCK